MATNWYNFWEFIAENILDDDSNITTEAKTKYGIKEADKLQKYLDNLNVSIENADSSYHKLPFLLKNDKIRTWGEIFPKVEEVFWGSKSAKTHIPIDIYREVEKIFNDFKKETEIVAELEQKAQEFEKGDNNYVGRQMLLKLDEEWKLTNYATEWLKKYNSLSKSKQAELENEKKSFENLLKTLADARAEEKAVKKTYWQKVKGLEWKTIGISVGIVLVILGIVWFFYRKIKS